jgi:hypothetical protein
MIKIKRKVKKELEETFLSIQRKYFATLRLPLKFILMLVNILW